MRERFTLVILVSNSLFIVLFALFAVAAVLMVRRGWAAEAACATVAAVGVVLPLVAVWLAPTAREGSMGATAVVVAAYILAWVLTVGGCAGVWVFARSRTEFEAAREAGVDGDAL